MLPYWPRSHIQLLVTMSCLPSPVKSHERCETDAPVAPRIVPVHVWSGSAVASRAEAGPVRPTMPVPAATAARAAAPAARARGPRAAVRSRPVDWELCCGFGGCGEF